MTSEQRKGYRILLKMFEISRTTTKRPDRACFNQVVRFLADCVRIHPLPKEDRPIADRLMPLAKACLRPGTTSPTTTWATVQRAELRDRSDGAGDDPALDRLLHQRLGHREGGGDGGGG
jgi:hypothetical protein